MEEQWGKGRRRPAQPGPRPAQPGPRPAPAAARRRPATARRPPAATSRPPAATSSKGSPREEEMEASLYKNLCFERGEIQP